MIYLRARYYNPATAQYLTRDPLDALTRSAYGYVNNNPLNGADPTGLQLLPNGKALLDQAGHLTAAKAINYILNKTAAGAFFPYEEPGFSIVADHVNDLAQAIYYYTQIQDVLSNGDLTDSRDCYGNSRLHYLVLQTIRWTARSLVKKSEQTIAAGHSLTIQVTGANGDNIPAGAAAAVLNVTAVDATTGGYFTIYPAGQTRPTATTVAFGPGGVVGNEVTVELSTTGAVTIYNNQGSTDAVVDVDGYFAAGSSTVAAKYRYSGDNLRMTKQVNNSSVDNMIWDTADPTPLLLSDGVNDYIYGPDNTPLEHYTATGTSTTPTWYQHDQQGSTIALLTQTNGPTQPAQILATATYTPYGQTATTTTPTIASLTPLDYDSQYTDPETALIYLRNRYYDPATAQFLNRDPLDLITRSAYGYVDGNPLNDTDPTGLYGYSFSWDIGNAGPNGPRLSH